MFKKLEFNNINSMRNFFYNIESDNDPNPDAFDFIISAVKYGLDTKVDTVVFASANTDNDIIDFAIHKNDFPSTLNFALKHYEELENFEECSKILKIIESLTE